MSGGGLADNKICSASIHGMGCRMKKKRSVGLWDNRMIG